MSSTQFQNHKRHKQPHINTIITTNILTKNNQFMSTQKQTWFWSLQSHCCNSARARRINTRLSFTTFCDSIKVHIWYAICLDIFCTLRIVEDDTNYRQVVITPLYLFTSFENVVLTEWTCCIHLEPFYYTCRMKMMVAGEGMEFRSIFIWAETYTALLEIKTPKPLTSGGKTEK